MPASSVPNWLGTPMNSEKLTRCSTRIGSPAAIARSEVTYSSTMSAISLVKRT